VAVNGSITPMYSPPATGKCRMVLTGGPDHPCQRDSGSIG
jgi:hypothetical protein